MKRIITAILLSAIITLFCGCAVGMEDEPAVISATKAEAVNSPEPYAPETTPEPSAIVTPATAETPLPSPKDPKAVIEALTARIKNNVDKGTFEGFTWDSTLQHVFEGADMELTGASCAFDADFLGHPARMECGFAPTLSNINLYILPAERTDYDGKITELLNKLDGALGGRTKNLNEGQGGFHYIWNTAKYDAEVWTEADRFLSEGELAHINVHSINGVNTAGFPDIFPYALGAEFDTVYKNESLLTGVMLKYLAGDVEISFNISGTLSSFCYDISIDMPDSGTAADFMEECMSSLQNVLGKPEIRNYSSHNFTSAAAEEFKESGKDQFSFYAHWDCIQLYASYSPVDNFSLSMGFTKNDQHG